MKDTAKHQGLRNKLAKLLEEKGITDKNVLEAIKRIPRHLFLNSGFEDFAYQDKAFPIAAGQTISQPYTVAFQTQLLQVKKDDKIAIISTNNRTEWNIMDIGVLQTGAQTIPIYPTISEDDYEYILNHSGAIYCFVSDIEVLHR